MLKDCTPLALVCEAAWRTVVAAPRNFHSWNRILAGRGRPLATSRCKIMHQAHKCKQSRASSLIRNEKNNCSLWEYCHVTVQAEAIAWARRCRSSQLTGGGQEKNNQKKWVADPQKNANKAI
jgi:hypothetical protein